jgi:hypothetical protein
MFFRPKDELYFSGQECKTAKLIEGGGYLGGWIKKEEQR